MTKTLLQTGRRIAYNKRHRGHVHYTVGPYITTCLEHTGCIVAECMDRYCSREADKQSRCIVRIRISAAFYRRSSEFLAEWVALISSYADNSRITIDLMMKQRQPSRNIR